VISGLLVSKALQVHFWFGSLAKKLSRTFACELSGLGPRTGFTIVNRTSERNGRCRADILVCRFADIPVGAALSCRSRKRVCRSGLPPGLCIENASPPLLGDKIRQQSAQQLCVICEALEKPILIQLVRKVQAAKAGRLRHCSGWRYWSS